MTSAELQQRIDTLTAEMTAATTKLNGLTDAKQRVLHDEKKLLVLEKEESELPEHIARLRERRRLLTIEQDAALTREAHARVPEIEQELITLGDRIATRRTAFLHGVDALLELIKNDTPDRQRAAELAAEAEYLHEAFGAPWPQSPAVTALNSTDTNKLDAEFTKRYQLRYAGAQWKELTEAIRTEHNRVAQKDADAARRASSSQMVRSTPTPFTAGKI